MHTSLSITNFRGPGTVACNAPTQVELHWQASGAPKFELRIDGGPVVATYPSGSRTELLPFECDGKHVYELSATVDGSTTKASVSVQSKPFD